MKTTWVTCFAGGLAVSLGACGAGEVEEGAAEAIDDVAAEIATAEVEWSALEADNEACFQQFRACRQGVERGSDAARACHEALRACLPERPAPPERARPDGGMRPPHARPDGGMRPDHRPGRARPVRRHVDAAALRACREQLHTCLDGDGDREVCIDAGRACVRDALAAAFAAMCAEVEARCAMDGAPVERCAHLQQRCAAGSPAGQP